MYYSVTGMTVTIGSSTPDHGKKGFQKDGEDLDRVIRNLPLKVSDYFG